MTRSAKLFSRRERSADTRSTGASVERRAAWHYRLRGYRVLVTNARAARNEIDLIVRRGQTLVFCEVKSKASGRFGHPAAMVDDEKQRRLRRAAEAWLAAHPELRDLNVRFDVVSVSEGRLERVAAAF